jgi:2-methylcitrate dehydratase
MSWERVVEKFDWLAEPFADTALRAEIVSAVDNLDQIPVSELAGLLSAVSPAAKAPRTRGRL